MIVWKRLPIGLLFVAVIAKAQTLPTVQIYSFSAVGGYAPNGNLTNYTDSVTGTWNLGYDNLNRLSSGTVTPAINQNQYFCWGYDSFGNRTIQAGSNQPFQTGSPTCQPASSATISNNLASYNNANQITSTNANGAFVTPGYDAAGNLTDDGLNQVLYDAENRVCAVFNRNTSAITQYLYDAEGRRVAKGHPANGNTLYCPTGPGDFIPDETYVVGQNGEQVSELDGSGHWIHSNVYGGGQLLATYSQDGSSQPLHFNITDHLGTKRVQSSAAGGVELTCLNLPFGDGPPCIGATEHFFTGKERDTESGFDYFGARYYTNTMGRFMSPDWSTTPVPIPFASISNPQSLNLYSYVGNNPLSKTDADGHCGQQAGGQECSKVTVSAKVTQQPGEAQTSKNGRSSTATAAGEVQYTVKNNGKPMADTAVHEDVNNKSSKDGAPQQSTTVTNDAKTNQQGVVGDTSSISITTNAPSLPGTNAAGQEISNSVYTKDTTQVLTVQTPSGATCSCTETRTMSNADSQGQPSSEFKITLTSATTQHMTPAKPPQP